MSFIGEYSLFLFQRGMRKRWSRKIIAAEKREKNPQKPFPPHISIELVKEGSLRQDMNAYFDFYREREPPKNTVDACLRAMKREHGSE